MKTIILIMLISTTSCFSLQFEFEGWTTVFDCKDIDNDNDMDIVIGSHVLGSATYPAATIMRNDGDCGFSLEYIYHPCGFGRYNNRNFLQDVNNNNFVDIVSISAIDVELVLRVDNNDNGVFNNFTEVIPDSIFMPSSHAFSFGDWDGDGYVEAFFVNYATDTLFWSYFPNDGNGNFIPFEENHYNCYARIESVDFDNDGFDEIINYGYYGFKIFSYPDTNYPVTEINWEFINGIFNFADFDNDGDIDICRSFFDDAADILYFSIFENLGNFTFIEHESTLEGGNLIYMLDWDRILAKDLNGDDLLDLAYFQGVFYNNGNYEFQELELLPINCGQIDLWGCFDFVDINGDTTLDFLTSYTNNAMEGFLEIWFQDSNGNFLEEPPVGITNDELIITSDELNNYPNPFNISTTIHFSIEESGFVELNIYNIKGRLVKQLANKTMEGGEHNVVWDGRNKDNRYCGSGIYLMDLILNGKSRKTSKVILLK